jgi:2-phosphoglycerate kinase
MSLALEQGILKCISTDTVRAVMRSYTGSLCPALHRSSYGPASEHDDPVVSWKETCSALEGSVEGLIDDAIERKTSIVLEGVSIAPSNKWLDKWEVCFVAVILYFHSEGIAQFDYFHV